MLCPCFADRIAHPVGSSSAPVRFQLRGGFLYTKFCVQAHLPTNPFPARAGNHRPYPCTWDALRGVGWHLLEGLPGRDPPFTAEPPGGNRRQRQKRQTVTIKSAGAAGGGPAPPEKKQRPARQQTRTQEQGQQKQPTTARPPRSPLMNATRRAGWRRRWPPQRGKEPQGQGEQPV